MFFFAFPPKFSLLMVWNDTWRETRDQVAVVAKRNHMDIGELMKVQFYLVSNLKFVGVFFQRIQFIVYILCTII